MITTATTAAAAAVLLLRTVGLAACCFAAAVFVVAPFALALATSIRRAFLLFVSCRGRKAAPATTSSASGTVCSSSCLYLGRVWHTRYRPVNHAFAYPLLIFGLDLEEMEGYWGNGNSNSNNDESRSENWWWPLCWIVQFRPFEDHLKNGEGMESSTTISNNNNNKSQNATEDDKSDDASSSSSSPSPLPSLTDRVFRLVSERTRSKFQPNRTTHAVKLVTQLRYYGYCFNPVSFYYVVSKSKNDSNSKSERSVVEAVVGEVSNTPWNEMHCYVLHPESVDVTRAVRRVGESNETNDENGDNHDAKQDDERLLNYVFPKTFHVSPFMEMEYDYDWTFQRLYPCSGGYGGGGGGDRLVISTSLKTKPKNDNGSTMTTATQFYARMDVRRTVPLFEGVVDGTVTSATAAAVLLSPFRLAWHVLARYPAYCAIVQVWIHYEAFWLFWKGVAFQPHPRGSETAASRAVAAVMAPFFALQGYYDRRKSSYRRKMDSNRGSGTKDD